MKPYHFERFIQLLDEIKPEKICEIGTHNGKTASQMCDYVLGSTNNNVFYQGYDAFDLIEFSESYGKEKNGKGIGSKIQAFRKLTKISRKYPDRLTFNLVKGFTKDTLTPGIYDFVYIDAGHSYESVLHDWHMVKDSKMIVFDDWFMEGVLKVLKEEVEPNHLVEYSERSHNDRGLAVVRNY